MHFAKRDNGVEGKPHDFTPTIHQLIELMQHKQFYDAVEDFEPLWSTAVLLAAEIRHRTKCRRADNTQFIWQRYQRLEWLFHDTVRDMQTRGVEQRLTALKPVIKRVLRIDARWLVFHCPLGDGVVHVMV
jgi:hypothetical protein